MPKLNFENASSVLGQFLQLYLQDKMLKERQELSREHQFDILREGQAIDTAQSFLPDIRAGKMMPGALPRGVAERLGGTDAIAAMMPSQAQMEAPAREQIRSAETQSDIPDINTLIAERASRGPITELGPLTGTLQARASRLDQIGLDQQGAMDRELAMREGGARADVMGREGAMNDTSGARAAREAGEANFVEASTRAEKLITAEKEANIKAAVELENQKKIITYRLAAEGAAAQAKHVTEVIQGAQRSVIRLNDLIELATEVNRDFNEGAIDIYAGFREAIGSIPYAGELLRGVNTGLSNITSQVQTGDPTYARKVNQLEGMRGEVAADLLRNAGASPISDTDIRRQLPRIPGAYESREATAAKSAAIRDANLLLPELMISNPGLSGAELLDLAFSEAEKRAKGRATAAPAPNQGLEASPTVPSSSGTAPSVGVNPLVESGRAKLQGR